jgi:FdhD protein
MAKMQEAMDLSELEGISPEISCERFSDEGWASIPAHVPSEMDLTIYVNQQELVTVLCTPVKLNCLVLGFLYDEGIITGMKDIASMRVCEDDALADVRLTRNDFKAPERRVLTSGCGGGATFNTTGQKVDSSLIISPQKVLSLMKQFQDRMELYRACGGVHASAFSDGTKLLVVAEDIGRHNTLDKIQGECLLRGLSTKDGVLLSTGRVSTEMLLKAAKMQVPVVVSRTSPTERAVLLAKELGIGLAGYVRASRMLVYAHPERFGRST